MHSHQRMTHYIRNIPDTRIGGRDSGENLTPEQLKNSPLIDRVYGGKTFGGTIMNRIRMFTYKIGAGGVIAIILAILLFLFIVVMRVKSGSFDFLSSPFKSTVVPRHKFEFF
jgi:hypothetical protein